MGILKSLIVRLVIVGVDAMTNQVRHAVDGCLRKHGVDVDQRVFLSPPQLLIINSRNELRKK